MIFIQLCMYMISSRCVPRIGVSADPQLPLCYGLVVVQPGRRVAHQDVVIVVVGVHGVCVEYVLLVERGALRQT